MAEKLSMGFLLCLGVIHLLRLGNCVWPAEDKRAVSDREHHFTSWGEPKCRGVYSDTRVYPASPESCCPLAHLCLLLQLGYSHSQAFQTFRRCPPWIQEVFFSSDPVRHWQPDPPVCPKAAQTMAAPCCVQLGSPPPVSASNALQLTLEETSQNPSYPSSNPWRAGLANGKQLQLVMLSWGIWVLAVRVPHSGPVDRL